MTAIEKIRNIAIIAHVDHGKTTLVDAMFKGAHMFRDNQRVQERAMDSNDQERERGITILAKTTALHWGGYRFNIVDTPGHADFGGEVERVLSMVDSVLLVVDAFDGPMPQTKFVTRKALALGLRPIVVINKVDRPGARPLWTQDAVFDLLIELGATDEQLDFCCVFASAKMGYAMMDINDASDSLDPLFDAIVKHCPPPQGDPEAPAADAGHPHGLQRLRRPDRHRPHRQRPDQGERAGGPGQAGRHAPDPEGHHALRLRGPDPGEPDRGLGRRDHRPGRHPGHPRGRDHRHAWKPRRPWTTWTSTSRPSP